jgi:hypothetical protein
MSATTRGSAIEECLPRTARQRCLADKVRNPQSKVPEDLWPEFKARADRLLPGGLAGASLKDSHSSSLIGEPRAGITVTMPISAIEPAYPRPRLRAIRLN